MLGAGHGYGVGVGRPRRSLWVAVPVALLLALARPCLALSHVPWGGRRSCRREGEAEEGEGDGLGGWVRGAAGGGARCHLGMSHLCQTRSLEVPDCI